MCGSFWESIFFGSSHLIAAYQVHRKKKPGYRAYRLFLEFYAIMEFFQASQWIFGDLMPISEFGHINCSLRNRMFTVTAYALIWIQPVIYSNIAEILTYTTNRHSRILSRITFIWAMVSLAIGLFNTPSYRIPNSNYGLSTCTEIGPYGHLAWRFAPNSVKYSPNEFIYVALVLLSFFQYGRNYNWVLGLGWTASMVISILSVGTGPDLPAYWCLLSVFADIPILLDTFL